MSTSVPIRVYSGPTGKPADCQTLPAPPAGICKLTAQLPFVLSDGVIVKVDTIDIPYKNISAQFDPADYPGLTGITVDFVGFFNTGDPNSLNWPAFGVPTYQIVDEDGNVYAQVSAPRIYNAFIHFSTTFSVPLRSGLHTYMLKTLAAPALVEINKLTSVVINLTLVNSAGWRIQIPLINGIDWANDVGQSDGHTIAGDNNDSFLLFYAPESWSYGCITTSYFTVPSGNPSNPPGTGGNYGFQTFKKDSSKWPTDVTWEFEVWGMILDRVASDTLYIGLINEDTNQLVAGSELAITASDKPTRYSVLIANNAANFTDGSKFRIRARYNTYNGSDSMYLYRANLYAKQPPAGAADGGKAQIVIPAGNYIITRRNGGYEYLTGGLSVADIALFNSPKTSWFFVGSYFGDLLGMSVDLIDVGPIDTTFIGSTPQFIPIIVATYAFPFNNAFDIFKVAFSSGLLTSGHRYMVRGTNLCGATIGLGQMMAETVC